MPGRLPPPAPDQPMAPAGAAATGRAAEAEQAEGPATLAPGPGAAKSPTRACFTSTGMELSERQQRIIRQLGFTVVRDWSPEVTHVIADTFRLTAKMMCAVCSGAHIVTPEYIAACRKQDGLAEEAEYLLKGDVCEAAFARKRGLGQGYSVAAAAERARRDGPLLRGMSVYCFPSVEDRHELPPLVAAAGGTWLADFPAEPTRDSVLLLASRRATNEQEEQQRRKYRVFDVELLREAAMTQEIRLSAYRCR